MVREILIVEKKVKQIVHENGMFYGSGLFAKLEQNLMQMLDAGIKRARENNRITVLERDI